MNGVNNDHSSSIESSNGSTFDKLTQEQETKSNAIDIPSISLPKGGGALKGIDEKFEVNPANGTAGFNLPLPISPGRNGFSPSLSLSYNSGRGNSIFGLGWAIDLPSIKRKTDKGIPRYREGEEEDVFILSGAEDLVPFMEHDETHWHLNEKQIGSLAVKRYRPRIEGSFSKIEKITHPEKGVYWKVTNSGDKVTFYGYSQNARISDPSNEENIFEWLPEFSYDNQGNCILYEYKQENLEQVLNEVYEKNRINGLASFSNTYLKHIKYGNHTPYFPAPSNLFDPILPLEDSYFFQLTFDYGEHPMDAPTPEEISPWAYRTDAFSSYRSGFEIRTNRLCKRVLMFHKFPALNAGNTTLINALDLGYLPAEELNTKANRPSSLNYLTSITKKGYVMKADNSYSIKALPTITFDYQWLTWNTHVKEVSDENLKNTPTGLSGNYQWVDLYNEGINGILTEQSDAWFYKSNLGLDDAGALRFSQAKSVIPKPSFAGLSNGSLQLQDLEANGSKQIMVNSPSIKGYFELSDDEEWEAFKAFTNELKVDLSDPNVRMLDINGDGKPEVVMSDQGAFWWWANLGKAGYDSPELATKPYDEESGPAIVFQDLEQRIFLADMTGDGLTDIVSIQNGAICYWANLGYGRFSAKVTMGNSPWFDSPELFNPQYIQVTDISGTGASDIIYLGKNEFNAYLNFSGNAWSEPTSIEPFFPTEAPNKITVTDLTGNGTACIVWSSGLPSFKNKPMKYIDLMGGIKPHILKSYQNGFGKTTEVEYKSSTHYYLKDKLEGKPWVTKLPFPVQCVSKIVMTESVTNVRFTKEYSYHHGYYDHNEREFRGFGRVDQIDCEHFDVFEKKGASNTVSKERHEPPILTKTWFNTGAFFDKDKIYKQFEKEFWYEEFRLRGFEVDPIEYQLPNTKISPSETLVGFNMDSLSTEEYREAIRACKGLAIRKEVFSLDAEDLTDQAQQKKQATPYSVSTHNCEVQLIQPKEHNKQGVFIVKESEAISYAYERNPIDPRITHSFNIKTDDYGNVLESASVVYPRIGTEELLENDSADTNATRKAKQHAKQLQFKNWITYVKNDFTNDVLTEEHYRLRTSWQTKTYELTGLAPVGDLFTIEDFNNNFGSLEEIEYQQEATAGVPQKRLIEHIKTKFYNDGLSAPLSDGQLGKWGVPYEGYQLAYTPNLIQHIYTPSDYSTSFEVSDADMLEGKFYQEDTNWWIRSGTIQFFAAGETIEDLKNRFFNPVSYTDPFGTKTNIFNDPLYLFINRTVDPLGNQTEVLEFNYRTLSPTRAIDINDNISSVVIDEIGLIKASAIEGKDSNNDNTGEEADNLSGFEEVTNEVEQNLIDTFFATAQVHDTCNYAQLQSLAKDLLKTASTRLVYNLNQQPTVVATIAREQHSLENLDSPVHISFEYTDGLGKLAMTKVQAESGSAKKATKNPDGSWDISEVDTESHLRWVGNGRTVLNNKGKPIKQYEPYFSVSPVYEDAAGLVETGVSPQFFYDAAGRMIKTELPNGSFSKVEFNAWKQYTYDTNDTVKDSTWYAERIVLPDNNPEKRAALKAALHHETPSCILLDTLNRPVLAIDHNRFNNNDDQTVEEFLYTYSDLDIEGNARCIFDARGNKVMEYQYDILGHRVAQTSMDAGKRWMLNNVLGNPVKTWDERKHEFSFLYDILQRPIEKWVSGGENIVPVQVLYEKIIYGENLPNDKENNWRGKPVTVYDTAGKISTNQYDFKGNSLSSTRIFTQDYKTIPNWDLPDPDTLLDGSEHTFDSSITYDALNRPIKVTNPDSSEYLPGFNPAGLLEFVNLKKDTDTTTYVENINYDSKGRRTKILYGNGVSTKYTYDPDTYRLSALRSTKSGGGVLQDLKYTYDPSGNITEIKDQAIPTVFYNNQKLTGKKEYRYDALYQLIAATGREQNTHAPNFNSSDNWEDGHAKFGHTSNDPMAMHAYTQKYQYDKVGNIMQLKHIAGPHSYTRDYLYEAKNNRIKTTDVGDYTYNYKHHEQHGFISEMPHLQFMNWNFKEELAASSKQHRTDGGTPETTYYVYDGNGQRVRKITENEADEGNAPTKKEERIYIGAYEVYRHENGLERETLHIMDDKSRIAMIDTETKPRIFMGIPVGRTTPIQTTRYQLSNHLGSSSLELDESAEVISYEEYHPYGTTAYQAKNTAIKAAAKRYRYTGMERDEETGLAYHSARYYLPWLGRWLSSDPLELIDGPNLYRYSKNNPVMYNDPAGTDPPYANDGDATNPLNFSTFESYRAANAAQPENVVWDVWSEAYSNDPSALSSQLEEPTPTNQVRSQSTGRVIEPPPPVSPTDYSLYVPQGALYSQYQAAAREVDNSDNSWGIRATFFVLGLAAGPLALAEEYVARPITNVPFVMHNAGIGIGEHAGRAYLWAQQDEPLEATVEVLHAIQDTSEGMVAGLSVGIPVAGAIESRLAASTTTTVTTESSVTYGAPRANTGAGVTAAGEQVCYVNCPFVSAASSSSVPLTSSQTASMTGMAEGRLSLSGVGQLWEGMGLGASTPTASFTSRQAALSYMNSLPRNTRFMVAYEWQVGTQTGGHVITGGVGRLGGTFFRDNQTWSGFFRSLVGLDRNATNVHVFLRGF